VTVRKTEGQPNLNRKQQDACIHTAEVTVRKSKAQIGRVEKTRWLVKSGHHIVEVDEFHGDNQGLVIAEIELADPDEPYTAPPFLGTEVTGIPRYYNGYLSRHPYNTW
jgi:adenylate cyclase